MAKQKKKSSGINKYLSKLKPKQNASGVGKIKHDLEVESRYEEKSENYVPKCPLRETIQQERMNWNEKTKQFEKEKYIPLKTPKTTTKKKKIETPKKLKKI